jgi:hypothetical protein
MRTWGQTLELFKSNYLFKIFFSSTVPHSLSLYINICGDICQMKSSGVFMRTWDRHLSFLSNYFKDLFLLQFPTLSLSERARG